MSDMLKRIAMDTEWVSEYLSIADSTDADICDLRDALLRNSMGPYQAASFVWKKSTSRSGSPRSFATLLYHARELVQDIYESYGGIISQAVDALSLDGDPVYIAEDVLPYIRKECRKLGIQLETDIRVRRASVTQETAS